MPTSQVEESDVEESDVEEEGSEAQQILPTSWGGGRRETDAGEEETRGTHQSG